MKIFAKTPQEAARLAPAPDWEIWYRMGGATELYCAQKPAPGNDIQSRVGDWIFIGTAADWPTQAPTLSWRECATLNQRWNSLLGAVSPHDVATGHGLRLIRRYEIGDRADNGLVKHRNRAGGLYEDPASKRQIFVYDPDPDGGDYIVGTRPFNTDIYPVLI